MQQAHALDFPTDSNDRAVALVPTARTGPGAGDPVELTGAIEEQVARLADFVLKVAALAERYESSLARLAPSMPAFAERQNRVNRLHSAAARGRSCLVDLGLRA